MTRRPTRGPALEWDVPSGPVPVEVIDERLRAGAGRTGLLQVVVDHDQPGVSRCPRCGWPATTTRRDCPSRVIALAVLERKPPPEWLAHLADEVPGARVRETGQTREERRSVEDALPSLFPAPGRRPQR